MKEYLMLLAKYNAHVNRKLYEIVGGLSEADRTKEVGSFFKSIFGLLNHIYSSDCGWLLRFRDKAGSHPALATPLLEDPLPPRGEPMFTDFATLRDNRPKLDEVIGKYVSQLSEDELAATFTFTTRTSGEKTLALWQALAHMFNHETHHRGAIAEVLDELGVSNDYSNLISIL